MVHWVLASPETPLAPTVGVVLMFVPVSKTVGFWAGSSVNVVVCTGLTVVCACAAPDTQTPTAAIIEATGSARLDAPLSRRSRRELRAARRTMFFDPFADSV